MQNFSFIQITDHHLLESEEQIREGFVPGHALRMVMRHIAGNVADKADFIISTGDLVEPPTEAAYACAAKLLGLDSSAMAPGPWRVNTEGLHNYPMYFVPGNHDDREMVTRCLFPDSKPARLYNFTFEHKGVQFIFMDWGPESKAVFLPETRQFLSQALQSDLPSVIVCHQPSNSGYSTALRRLIGRAAWLGQRGCRCRRPVPSWMLVSRRSGRRGTPIRG